MSDVLSETITHLSETIFPYLIYFLTFSFFCFHLVTLFCLSFTSFGMQRNDISIFISGFCSLQKNLLEEIFVNVGCHDWEQFWSCQREKSNCSFKNSLIYQQRNNKLSILPKCLCVQKSKRWWESNELNF